MRFASNVFWLHINQFGSLGLWENKVVFARRVIATASELFQHSKNTATLISFQKSDCSKASKITRSSPSVSILIITLFIFCPRISSYSDAKNLSAEMVSIV